MKRRNQPTHLGAIKEIEKQTQKTAVSLQHAVILEIDIECVWPGARCQKTSQIDWKHFATHFLFLICHNYVDHLQARA
jgi:hypothetical protein